MKEVEDSWRAWDAGVIGLWGWFTWSQGGDLGVICLGFRV